MVSESGRQVVIPSGGGVWVNDAVAAGARIWWTGLGVAQALLAACTAGSAAGEAGDGGGGGVADAAPGVATAVVGADRAVIAGVTVPLDGSRSTAVSAYAWEQVSGPALAIAAAGEAVAWAAVPEDAPAGTEYVFRLSVTGAVASDSAELTVAIMAAKFADVLGGIDDTGELGTSEGIDFDDEGMWIVSTGGFVSRFDAGGAFQERIDIPGAPVGASFASDGRLLVARSDLGRVDALDTSTGDLVAVASAVEGGGDLDTANLPLPDAEGNLYVTNRQGQKVFRRDAGGVTRVFLDGLGTNPNAIAFGPEPDVLYVGVVGSVYRVPIQPNGTAGEPELYVSVGSSEGIDFEIDGLAFDEGRNLWIGCPNSESLFVAAYAASGATAVSRSWNAVSATFTYFVNIRHGRGSFGETVMYYTNLGDRTVGRIATGLAALAAPLAVVRE